MTGTRRRVVLAITILIAFVLIAGCATGRGSVTGVVRFTDGRAVVGADIGRQAQVPGVQTSQEGISSGADGTFTIANLQSVPWQVTAHKDGRRAEAPFVIVLPGGRTRVELVLDGTPPDP
jgi:hypothetical protein